MLRYFQVPESRQTVLQANHCGLQFVSMSLWHLQAYLSSLLHSSRLAVRLELLTLQLHELV